MTVGAARNVNWSAAPVGLVPLGVVTVMSTVPAVCAGEVAVIDVALFTVNDAAAVAPKLTAVAPVKPVPVIVTDVPPAVGPLVGLTLVTVGPLTNVNWSHAPVALVPLGVVTVTSTVPAVCAGEVAVIDVALFTVNDAAGVAPNCTAVAPVKPVPVIVTDVPPAVGPLVGLTLVTVGAAGVGELVGALVASSCRPESVAVMSTVPVPAGAVAVIDVSLFTVNDVAAVAPKATAVVPVKSKPVIVTDVPPAVGPLVGLTPVMMGVQVEPAGRHVGFAVVVGPPVPTSVAEMPSVCGTACGRLQVVAAGPGPMRFAVVNTTAPYDVTVEFVFGAVMVMFVSGVVSVPGFALGVEFVTVVRDFTLPCVAERVPGLARRLDLAVDRDRAGVGVVAGGVGGLERRRRQHRSHRVVAVVTVRGEVDAPHDVTDLHAARERGRVGQCRRRRSRPATARRRDRVAVDRQRRARRHARDDDAGEVVPGREVARDVDELAGGERVSGGGGVGDRSAAECRHMTRR